MDTTDEDSIAAAADAVAALHSHLDVLLNVSGVLHVPGVMTPETALSRVTMDNLMAAFQTNAFGPILVCKAMAPLLLAAPGASE